MRSPAGERGRRRRRVFGSVRVEGEVEARPWPCRLLDRAVAPSSTATPWPWAAMASDGWRVDGQTAGGFRR
jgi:hypothetical protein